jgi:hypothetical protein
MLNRIMKAFKGWHDKKITLLLIGTGCTLALAGFSTEWWIIPLIQLINEFLHLNLPVPDSEKVDYIILFAGLFAGGAFIYFGFRYNSLTRSKRKKMLQIRHSSIEVVNYTKVEDEIDEYDVKEFPIHFTKEMIEINEFNLMRAWMKQEEAVSDLRAYLDGSSDTEVAYLALAHIPFVILFGYQIADKTDVTFFEWNRNKLTWQKLKNKDITFPTMHLERIEDKQAFELAEEVVVKIGITYPIPETDLRGLGLEEINTYYLHLSPPRWDAVVSVEQLNEYKKQFRELLTEIHQKYPKLKKIHLFYSGQPSLAFKLGSAISPRMDMGKDIWVYNYVSSSEPKYPWALKLSRKWEKDCIKIIKGDMDVQSS